MLLTKFQAFGNKTWADSTFIQGSKREILKFEKLSHFFNLLYFQLLSQQVLSRFVPSLVPLRLASLGIFTSELVSPYFRHCLLCLHCFHLSDRRCLFCPLTFQRIKFLVKTDREVLCLTLLYQHFCGQCILFLSTCASVHSLLSV